MYAIVEIAGQQFKVSKETYHHKNILYDQAVEAAIRELR